MPIAANCHKDCVFCLIDIYVYMIKLPYIYIYIYIYIVCPSLVQKYL